MITKDKVEFETTVVRTTEKIRGSEKLEYILYHEEKDGRDSFSVQAIQYKKGMKICQATACDVSSRHDFAEKIFSAVSEGYVEPYVLCDVIYDLLP